MNHFKRVFALLVCICLMAAALAGIVLKNLEVKQE